MRSRCSRSSCRQPFRLLLPTSSSGNSTSNEKLNLVLTFKSFNFEHIEGVKSTSSSGDSTSNENLNLVLTLRSFNRASNPRLVIQHQMKISTNNLVPKNCEKKITRPLNSYQKIIIKKHFCLQFEQLQCWRQKNFKTSSYIRARYIMFRKNLILLSANSELRFLTNIEC